MDEFLDIDDMIRELPWRRRMKVLYYRLKLKWWVLTGRYSK